MSDEMSRNIAAFEQTVRSTIALGRTLGPAEWDVPTGCPGWTVKDIFAHLASVELMLLGEPTPEHALPAELPHVRSDMGRLMEVGVDLRRTVPGEKVVGELRETLERRLVALRDIDPAQQTMSPTGRIVSYAEFMAFRAFDCWVHEQDIRVAVGRPGNLDTPAARCTCRMMRAGLPYVVVKKAGAAPGQAATFEVTGPISFTAHVRVGDDGRATEGEGAADATVTLRLDWETYVRLSAGRCTPAEVSVSVSGDTALGDRILANMGVTP